MEKSTDHDSSHMRNGNEARPGEPVEGAAPDQCGEKAAARWTPASFFARQFHVVIPCALVLLYAFPLVFYQIPGNFDTLTESFEPIKTLKFVHSKGRAFHKWGPMPNFIDAPLYAPLLGYWYLVGDLGYRLVEIVTPRVPRWLDLPLVRELCSPRGARLLVYRRDVPQGPIWFLTVDP